ESLGPGRPRDSWDHAWRAGLRGAANARYTQATASLIETLRGALPDDAIVVSDQTGINYWMEWRFPVLLPRTFLYPVGSATLGYGVPAAIGAKVACPDRADGAVVGGGGLLFTAQEAATGGEEE